MNKLQMRAAVRFFFQISENRDNTKISWLSEPIVTAMIVLTRELKAGIYNKMKKNQNNEL
jgi:hypothetical protein